MVEIKRELLALAEDLSARADAGQPASPAEARSRFDEILAQASPALRAALRAEMFPVIERLCA